MSYAASTLLRFVPPAVSGSAHAALIVALIVISPLPKDSAGAGVSVFEVAMVDEGELAQASPSPGAAPQGVPPEEAAIAPPAEPPAEPPAPASIEPVTPPESVAPEAVIVPAPKPKLAPRTMSPAVAERPRPSVQRRSVAPQRAVSSREISPREAGAGGAQQREGARARGGAGRDGTPGSGLSGAAYAGKVRAILQARANALGIEDQEGSVGLSFVIGGSGRMESHAITRTSGSASVDRMIRGMMASSSFPPPPGGRFSGTVNIRIQ